MKKTKRAAIRPTVPGSPPARPSNRKGSPFQAGDAVPGWLRLAPGYIVLAVLLVYSGVLKLGFLGFDDTDILVNRYFLIGDLSNLRLAFTTDALLGTTGSFYRPLQTISFMLDASIGGPAPFIYHLSNLILHLAGSLCVFWLLLTLGYQRLLSLLLALLFALHPMFVFTVAWVPTRGDLLLAIFVMGSFILFVNSFSRNQPYLMLGHAAAFFLAFLAKETALALPALCLSYYYFELRRHPFPKLLYGYCAVWLGVAAAWYALRSQLHSGQLVGDYTGLAAVSHNLRMLPELLGKFLLPIKLQLLPLFNSFDTGVGLAAAAALGGLLFHPRLGAGPRARFGLLWFLLCLLPVLILRRADAAHTFDYLYHRAYLPSVGLILLLAALASRILGRIALPRLALAALPVLAGCALATFQELGYYRDQVTFYTEAIARTPQNALAHNNRGIYYADVLNKPELALADYDRAINLYPGYVKATVNRAVTKHRLGQSQAALADLDTALRLDSDFADAYYNRGAIRSLLKSFPEALSDYNRAIELKPDHREAYLNRGALYSDQLNRYDEAIADFKKVLNLDPSNLDAALNIGIALYKKKDYQQAIGQYTAVLSSSPHNGRVYYLRALAYAELSDYANAVKDGAQAKNLGVAVDEGALATWQTLQNGK